VPGTETLMAKHRTESLAGTERLMEEVGELENGQPALPRIKGNKGSPGVDGMTVDELQEYRKPHGLEIGEQLRNGTYQPPPRRRVEIPKPEAGERASEAFLACGIALSSRRGCRFCSSAGTRRSPNPATVSDRGAVRSQRGTRRSRTSPEGTAGWWISTWRNFWIWLHTAPRFMKYSQTGSGDRLAL
jgi:hypothetical protein